MGTLSYAVGSSLRNPEFQVLSRPPHRDCTCITRAVAVANLVDTLKSRTPFLSYRPFQTRAYHERSAVSIQEDNPRRFYEAMGQQDS